MATRPATAPAAAPSTLGRRWTIHDTVIHVSAWYDNTRANPYNPDPDQWVGYGDRTVDEMAHAWMNVVYLTDDEYKALLAERKAKAEKAAPTSTK